ncbi:Nucleolar protein 14 [Linum grandiflorum]
MAAKSQNKAHKGSENKNKNNNKKKKSKRTGTAVVAMKQKAAVADNPFETIWSRRKFDVLGKKRKGEERRVGSARSKAIEKRKNTLLVDYQRSSKSSVFVDNRIGEGNAELSEFDKNVMRSQKEHKMKLGKKNMFNLSDGEEEEDEFGSSGLGSFGGRDDFEDEMGFDEEEDGETEKSGILRNLDSPGMAGDDNGELQENIHKSKKEVMQEIIMKSKHFKAEKAKEKEENEKLMEELDEKFTSLEQSKVISSLIGPSEMDVVKPAVTLNLHKTEVTNDKLPTAKGLETRSQEQPDSYDKLFSEMVFDIRARPSDRTKTPEEIAEDERERLERLEEERQKRMSKAKDSSDEDDSDTERPLNKRHHSVSGDDLGDSFSVPEPGTRKGWVDEILEREEAEESEDEENDASEDSESGEEEDEGSEEESEEEDVAHGKVQSLKDWEQSDDENVNTDLEDDDDDNDDEKDVTEMGDQKKVKIGKVDKETQDVKKKKAMQSDLPFLIEAPKTMEELSALVETRSNADIIVIINRIRASNAIKLAAENRKKMQCLFLSGVLRITPAVLCSFS